MIQRTIQLYREGGVYELMSGAKRFFRNKRRYLLNSALSYSNHPLRALKRYTLIRRSLQPTKYTKADPFKTVYVDPEKIQFAVRDVPTAWGLVVGGNWKRIPFEEITVHGAPLHESNILHFDEGVPWEDTPVYEARMGARGSGPRQLTSAQDVENYFQSLDRLYESMRTNGYMSQTQLIGEDQKRTINRNNDEIHPRLNEIGVNIGKSGNILWSRCGKHRLSIAKVLNIDQVPVQVRTRHKEWEQLRRELSSGNCIPARYRSHPDLTDLVRDSKYERGLDQ